MCQGCQNNRKLVVVVVGLVHIMSRSTVEAAEVAVTDNSLTNNTFHISTRINVT